MGKSQNQVKTVDIASLGITITLYTKVNIYLL